MQTQIEGSLAMLNLQRLSEGLPPLTAINTNSVGGFIQEANQNAEFMNPANGATPAVEFTGIGNQPSPEAGFNTTAPRQRDTGLVDAEGNPLTSR